MTDSSSDAWVEIRFGLVREECHRIVKAARWMTREVRRTERYRRCRFGLSAETVKLLEDLEDVARSISAADIQRLMQGLGTDVDPASTEHACAIISKASAATRPLVQIANGLRFDLKHARLAARLKLGMARVAEAVYDISEELEPIVRRKCGLDFGSPD